MKRFLLLLPLFLMTLSSFCQTSDFDFRKVKWGMTKAQVKANEKLEFVLDGGDYIRYKGSVLNSSASVTYFLKNNKLVGALVMFDEKHFADNLYVDDHESYKKCLTAKYGEPTDDDEKWSDNRFKGKPDEKGLAVSVEHLSCLTLWNTNRSRIGLFMNGEDYQIKIAILYDDKEFIKNKGKKIEETQIDEI